ncbi:MAG: hypothetical protein KDD59_01440 [Bdellovibrionales bacterium]|nr:hypothetical protein [Bdellovibrionales bacterium]
MTYHELDFIFPFIVLFYGALLTFVLHSETLVGLAEKHFPPQLLTQMQGHRLLALICLVVGGVWSLQNLWVGQNPF